MKRLLRLFTFQVCAIVVAFSHTAIAAESGAFGNSVAVQRDGNIVVAGSVHAFARLYEITVSFKDNGTADTAWKLRDDR